MIDFNNKTVFKLSKGKEKNIPKEVYDIMIDGEGIIGFYSSIRDFVIFTNKRIIACNVQGITGSKKDYTSLPYSKIQAFSVESAGTFDMDSELEVILSGLGKVKFEFSHNSDITFINKTIAEHVL